MDPLLTDPHLLNARHAQAHAEACRLRRAAAGELWRAADAVLATAATASRRSAARWLRRLQRHRSLRQSLPPAGL